MALEVELPDVRPASALVEPGPVEEKSQPLNRPRPCRRSPGCPRSPGGRRSGCCERSGAQPREIREVGEEVAADGRRSAIAVLEDHESGRRSRDRGCASSFTIVRRASKVFDVDEAGLLVVEGIHDVDDAEGIRAAPVDDLAADRQVEVRVEWARTVDLAGIHLPLVDVEHLPAVVAASLDAIHEVVPAEDLGTHLPVEGQLCVDAHETVEVEAREPAEIRVAPSARRIRGGRSRRAVSVGRIVIEIVEYGAGRDRAAEVDVAREPSPKGSVAIQAGPASHRRACSASRASSKPPIRSSRSSSSAPALVAAARLASRQCERCGRIAEATREAGPPHCPKRCARGGRTRGRSPPSGPGLETAHRERVVRRAPGRT